MKASLKSLAPSPKTSAPEKTITPQAAKNYREASTRINTRQVSGHFPAEDVQAFRVLAARLDMDVQELLSEAINMVFERHGEPNRIVMPSGRRKRD